VLCVLYLLCELCVLCMRRMLCVLSVLCLLCGVCPEKPRAHTEGAQASTEPSEARAQRVEVPEEGVQPSAETAHATGGTKTWALGRGVEPGEWGAPGEGVTCDTSASSSCASDTPPAPPCTPCAVCELGQAPES